MSAENGIIEPSIVDAMQAQRARLMSADSFDAVAQIEIIYQLWWRWADFHVFITTPVFDIYSPPHVILPERLDGDTYEFVYPIMDYGDRFSTSKGLDSLSAGLSMWKLYCTIEKIIALLIERLKTGGVSTETEVQICT